MPNLPEKELTPEGIIETWKEKQRTVHPALRTPVTDIWLREQIYLFAEQESRKAWEAAREEKRDFHNIPISGLSQYISFDDWINQKEQEGK